VSLIPLILSRDTVVRWILHMALPPVTVVVVCVQTVAQRTPMIIVSASPGSPPRAATASTAACIATRRGAVAVTVVLRIQNTIASLWPGTERTGVEANMGRRIDMRPDAAVWLVLRPTRIDPLIPQSSAK
jgi:hypothetical protein